VAGPALGGRSRQADDETAGPHAAGVRASAVGTIRDRHEQHRVLRARFTVQPRLSRRLDSQPPPMDPTSAMTLHRNKRKGDLRELDAEVRSRNFGSQYR